MQGPARSRLLLFYQQDHLDVLASVARESCHVDFAIIFDLLVKSECLHLITPFLPHFGSYAGNLKGKNDHPTTPVLIAFIPFPRMTPPGALLTRVH